ncbi:tetratricopeptide repeat protein [Streptomyces sp. HNM0645]|uniref:tetratricopeptide repeat protein n=1 Tax=Streptomyces sp. HNM0645 TaxID=2782343 RepID=UPI0024B6C917|nr:tetratricopeptide repeat protein [Streptomyces sp. HNM0645]MDI9888651.1 tetratricopeptide repeat protein [Streptomyces sp. HNM0645]
MTSMTPDEIRQGLGENACAPYGAARNARAEALSAAAEATGDRELFRRSLQGLIDAYEYSAERTRMVVPFARLLQEYDRDPSSFGSYEVHSLYWRFKWVAGRIVESPEIPLATVDRWLTDMERRYRLAGYSERAVRQAEFHLADAIGDEARMDRAMAGWSAAERDGMSDCHACEINTQGWYRARKGDDAGAVETWEPVLSGGQSCMEEPHRVLAHSLLPLVRLGRTAEARSHHLRGYRMTRGKDSLLRSVGEHIEFCALTGNESRGLEILAEHASHLGPLADVESQMEFTGGVLVLLRRLGDLGHGHLPATSYQGTARTVGELYELLHADAFGIAARFDARNGSAHVSARLSERIARQPLLGVLPLGVRSHGLPAGTVPVRPVRAVPVAVAGEAVQAPAGTAARAVPAGAPGAGSGVETAAEAARADFTTLVERARTARRRGHPSADGLWTAVARLAGAHEEGADAGLAGDLLEHRAHTAASAGAAEAVALFTEAAGAHRAAGEHGRAAYAELAAAGSAVGSGAGPDEIRRLLGTALATAEALDESDPSRPRRLASAELTRIRIESFLRGHVQHAGEDGGAGEHREDDGQDGPGPGVDAVMVAELEAFVAGAGASGVGAGLTGAVPARSAGAAAGLAAAADATSADTDAEPTAADTGMRAAPASEVADVVGAAELLLAKLALTVGDLGRAEPLLDSAARHCLAAERPWEAVEPLAVRARVLAARGALDDAEAAARTALGHAGEVTDGVEQAAVRMTLAEVLLRRGGECAEESAAHALDAAHWFDQEGLAAAGGAGARLLLARAYAVADRTAEAAEVLQSALPDLLEHGEEEGVQARETLGRLLQELRDPRAAAEQFLQAAETVKGWGEPGPEAGLAHSAAEALGQAGLRTESETAYARALELYRLAGDNPVGEVRALRSLAWMSVGGEHGDEEGTTGGADRARALMERALDVLDGSDEPRLRYERAQTWLQLAQLLDDGLDRDDDEEDDGDDDFDDNDDVLDAEGQEDGGAVRSEHDLAADAATREEMVRLLGLAAAGFAEFGEAALRDRVQCLVRAAWTERALGRAVDGTARMDALVGELKELETETSAGLLRHAEYVRDQLAQPIGG